MKESATSFTCRLLSRKAQNSSWLVVLSERYAPGKTADHQHQAMRHPNQLIEPASICHSPKSRFRKTGFMLRKVTFARQSGAQYNPRIDEPWLILAIH